MIAAAESPCLVNLASLVINLPKPCEARQSSPLSLPKMEDFIDNHLRLLDRKGEEILRTRATRKHGQATGTRGFNTNFQLASKSNQFASKLGRPWEPNLNLRCYGTEQKCDLACSGCLNLEPRQKDPGETETWFCTATNRLL